MSVSLRPIVEKREPRGNQKPKQKPKFHMGTSNKPEERYKDHVWDGTESLPLCICECGNWIAARTKGSQSGIGKDHRRVKFVCEYRNESWHKGNYNDTYTVLIPKDWSQEGES